jgi:hypothetical protein
MRKLRLWPLLVLILLAQHASFVHAQGPGIRRAARPIPGRYIVVLSGADDAMAVGLQTQNLFGGRLQHVYRQAVRGFSIRMSAAAAQALARDPRVAYVEEDGLAEAADVQAGPPSWGLDRMDQRALPLDGQYSYPPPATPVHVHVLDSGIRETHVDFGGRAFIAGDFIDDDKDGDPNDVGNDDGDPATPDGRDCNGHGTHVAGEIGGSVYGVAKDAIIHSYRVLDCSGVGPISGILAAFDAVVADGRRPAIANLSLGAPASFTLDNAVRTVIARGVTVVVAAGNDGVDARSVSPARVDTAITVGATDPADTRAYFSNFGPAVDVFAPGVSIPSASYLSDTAVGVKSGTSMAAPYVAGVAALYLEQHGDRPPAEVRDAIVAAATAGVVIDPGLGSPNELLYSAFTIPPVSGQRVNVAGASQGAAATASSVHDPGFAPSGAIDGNRSGSSWGGGGGWNDATPASFPDWLEVDFAATRTIDEIDVFSVQDTYWAPSTPVPDMTFSLYGLTDFTLQYWTGQAWQDIPGGSVSGNTLVWRTVSFAPVTTSRIRLVVTHAQDALWSRVTEIEAYSTGTSPLPDPRPNVASAVRGASATASSYWSGSFAPDGAINGDRRGAPWGDGAGWNDGTPNSFPDWLEIDFVATKTIAEIDVFSVQDTFWAPSDPTPDMTFSLYGVTDFVLQYWTGASWEDIAGGSVSGNSSVWRAVTFAPVVTSRIRVVVLDSADHLWSRIAEVEAYGP